MPGVRPIETEVVVVGSGPGGAAAAFEGAQAGKKVILVERDNRLGGVCLNAGCIPSKAYLHATQFLRERPLSAERGIVWKEPKIETDRLRAWKESVLDRLGKGLEGLVRGKKIERMTGRAYFEDSQTLRVETEAGQKFIRFEKAIIAVGSKPALPAAFDLGNPRIMTSTEVLDLPDLPENLLVVGGGYIGLELGTVYASLGSRVCLVEALDCLLAGADPDLVRPVAQYAQQNFSQVLLKTKVLKMATAGKQIQVVMQTGEEQKKLLFDRVLVAVGRVPNCADLGLQNTKVTQDEKGFIEVDLQRRTKDPNIYAIGDVVGGAMLAHKAAREARIAVEAILGKPAAFEQIVIPAVVFTDPEVAWCGLTEAEARERKIRIQVARFPWSASGRALTLDRPDGLTKLILEPESDRVLGVGIVGVGAGELISEGVVAVEMAATARDLAESVHPHPTLSETLMEAALHFYASARPASRGV